MLRIAITIAILAYLFLNQPTSAESSELWTAGVHIMLGFLCYSTLLLVATLVWPRPIVARRIAGIFGDVGGLSFGLYLTGPMGAPWYGVYLWVTLGYGFRYGEKYLYTAGAASLVGFVAVVTHTPYWFYHTELAIGLAVTLLVIPAYSGILIRRLNEARQRADAASRAKSDFLSRMSHEIRTPLNGILGMTELLRTRPLDPEDWEYVETIHASGKTLAHQIDEILDLSKIEAGELSVEKLEFDLYALINTTLRIFEPQIADKHIQLQDHIDPQTPFLLYGDPHKLRQIIINLVGNAVKFTDQGFVTLRVYPRQRDEDRITLRFEVADTGSGIPADRLNLIFEPFAQADSSVSRSHGGTGLGTTICKHLIELMEGEIGVQSTLNVGTTFWFDLTFETKTPLALDVDQLWVTKCRVIYLRDRRNSDESVAEILREWKVPFRTIHGIDQARQIVSRKDDGRQAFDALIIDGFPYDEEMAQLLSHDRSFVATPVILIGAETYPPEVTQRTHDHLYALNSPAEKPVLFNTLHACYSRHSTEDDVFHIAHQQVKEQRPSRELNVLIGDDNATNRLVLKRMLGKLGHQCTVVTGGEEVLTALEHSQFDVAVVDKNMPDMNGIDVFNAYSMAHGGRPPAKFVILTADATAESRDSCTAAGIEYFLTKPVSLARLQETLLDATETGQYVEPESGAVSEELQDVGTAPVVDEQELEKLKLLAGDDVNFMRDMIANFEDDANRDIRGLEVAVANRDRVAFRDSAHALKGAAMYLGLRQLAELSLEAQNLDHEEFERSSIQQIQAIQQATDTALRVLREKLEITRKLG